MSLSLAHYGFIYAQWHYRFGQYCPIYTYSCVHYDKSTNAIIFINEDIRIFKNKTLLKTIRYCRSNKLPNTGKIM